MAAPFNSPPLPNELLSLVFSYLDSRATLASIARASRALNEVATPELYRHLVITRRNASALFSGLPRSTFRQKKEHFKNKQAWNKAKKHIGRRFGHMMRYGARIGEDSEEPECEWTDSEPETDDDEAPPPKGDESAWARKLKLLGYCRSLAIVQMPPKALCRDILTALGVKEDDEGAEDATSTTKLFPLLTHLAFGERAVLKLSECKDLERLNDDPRHPFVALAGVLGTPTSVCVACPPAENPSLDKDYVLRRLRTRLSEICDENVTYVLYDALHEGQKVRCARAQVVVSTLPSSVRNVTVHNIRYSWGGIPYMDDNESRTYRYEYAPKDPETVFERATGVTVMLGATAPVSPHHSVIAEHVGIGKNISLETGSDDGLEDFDLEEAVADDDVADDDNEDSGDDDDGGEPFDDWDDDPWYDDNFGDEDGWDFGNRQEHRPRPRRVLDRDDGATRVIAEVEKRIDDSPIAFTLAPPLRTGYLPSDADPKLEEAVADAKAAHEEASEALEEVLRINREMRVSAREPVEAAEQAMRKARREAIEVEFERPQRFRVKAFVEVKGSTPTREERDAAREAYDSEMSSFEQRFEKAKAAMAEAAAELRSRQDEYNKYVETHQKSDTPQRDALAVVSAHLEAAKDAANKHKEEQRLRRIGPMPPAKERLRYIHFPTTCEVCGRLGGADSKDLRTLINEYGGRWRL